MPERGAGGEMVLRGIPVSAGICRGKVLVLGRREQSIPHYAITPEAFPGEINRLEQALVQTRQQILELQHKVSDALGAQNASVFEAHLMVLDDPLLIDEVNRVLEQDQVNIEAAFHKATEKLADTFHKINDEYLRERVADLRDVSARVLNNLLGRTDDDAVPRLQEPCIILSFDLSPSTTAGLDRKLVLGFGTDIGSKTSHTAIMARSLQIPAVVGLHNASEKVASGQYILLDGYNGLVILNPSDQTLFEYGQLVRRQVNLQERLRDIRDMPAVTLDGTVITLSANIEEAADCEAVQAAGAQGVGLFRTEYLFIHRNALPSEEEQFEAYRQVAATLKPSPVVIRTLDLGGDKFLSHLELPQEMNPFLGWRAIRLCLMEKDLFRVQLRAILRASAHGNVKMMYPMISGLEELNQANALVEECRTELRREGHAFDEAMEVGVMIEIPSAAMIADALAKRAHFLSIGTNDLIQYSLAVDRLNEKIAHLYEPTHPAILRLMKMTIDAGHRHHRWVGVCGEMAGDASLTPLLVGLGVDELSTAPGMVAPVKSLIRSLKAADAKGLAEFALESESASEILARSQALAHASAPGLFEKETRP